MNQNCDSKQTACETKKCCCPHHMMMPAFVILFGLTFFLRNIGIVEADMANKIWPVWVMLAGGQRLCESKCKCC